jgi:adenylosuccinate synthase
MLRQAYGEARPLVGPVLASLVAGGVVCLQQVDGGGVVAQCSSADGPVRNVLVDPTGIQSRFAVVLGAQWGDEGKGKLVDILAQRAELCVRFNGGANAGHTLVVGRNKFAFHLLPCGMINKDCINFIGNGVVCHIPTMLRELEQLKNFDPNALKRLYISSRAHVLLDSHRSIDGMLEAEKDGKAIGTTRRGIGPCYASKATRNGIRFADLINEETLGEKIYELLKHQKLHYANALVDSDSIAVETAKYKEFGRMLRSQIVDGVSFLHGEIDIGKKILIEGANAALLDIDFGTYPFVTSSSTTIGGVCTGLGVSPKTIDCTIGVVKAYTTRVGNGPFPTELHDDVGNALRKNGHEFGTTTGRPRRCGWLDVPLLRYSHRINGYDSLNITKLDVMTGLPHIKICTHYRIGDRILPDGYMPASLEQLATVEPVYLTLPGWTEDISQCTSFSELPYNAQRFLSKIEQLTGVPISWVGVGPDREAMFLMPAFAGLDK